jgi:L-iditol 2-dehydrogenase
MDEAEVPQIGSDQVLVRVGAVGISEADVHAFRHGPDRDVVIEDYLRLGRGIGGEIVGVGADVEDRRAGQGVAVMPGYPCLSCEACRAGEYSLCSQSFLLSNPLLGGSYTDHVLASSEFTCVLPDSVSFEECAMVMPLSVGLHAADRADLMVAQDVGVIGADEIGLMCLMASRVRAAGTIVVSDAYPKKLEAARGLGATDTINTGRANAVAVVDELTRGQGLGVVFETTGRPEGLSAAIGMAGFGAVIVVAGAMPPIQTEMLGMDVIVKELDIHGASRQMESPEPAVALISRGLVDMRSAITSRFPFEHIEEALKFADEHEDEAVKVLVEF